MNKAQGKSCEIFSQSKTETGVLDRIERLAEAYTIDP